MKRSTHLRLTLMAAAIPVALAGCDAAPDTGVVIDSANDCTTRTDLQVSAIECKTAYDKALAEHRRVAPRFENAVDCNDQFSDCAVVNDNGRDYYVPPMNGFLLGYAVSSLMRGGHSSYAYRYGGNSVPLYRNRDGGFYNPGGGYVSGGSGRVKGAAGMPSAPARAVTVGRGGFGASSAAHASFGGGRGGFGG